MPVGRWDLRPWATAPRRRRMRAEVNFMSASSAFFVDRRHDLGGHRRRARDRHGPPGPQRLRVARAGLAARALRRRAGGRRPAQRRAHAARAGAGDRAASDQPRAPARSTCSSVPTGRPSRTAAVDAAVALLGDRLGRLTLATVVPFGDVKAPERRAAEQLRRQAGRVPTADLEVLHGHPSEALRQCAVEGGYQLIVVGTRGKGLTRAVLGSAATELARDSEVPVLLVGERQRVAKADAAPGDGGGDRHAAPAAADRAPASATTVPAPGPGAAARTGPPAVRPGRACSSGRARPGARPGREGRSRRRSTRRTTSSPTTTSTSTAVARAWRATLLSASRSVASSSAARSSSTPLSTGPSKKHRGSNPSGPGRLPAEGQHPVPQAAARSSPGRLQLEDGGADVLHREVEVVDRGLDAGRRPRRRRSAPAGPSPAATGRWRTGAG